MADPIAPTQPNFQTEPIVPKQAPSTPPGPNLIGLINVLTEKADPIVKLLTTSIEGYQKGKQREVRFQTHMTWVAALLVLAIVGVAAYLTDRGKVDGSTFTFLLGLIVGYVLTFVRDQITGPE